jgi:CRP-like cAMP-binding protein
VSSPENSLIERLPRTDRKRLLACCEPVQLVLSEVLHLRGDITGHAFFPVDSFISLLTDVDSHPMLEVGMVGREGMVGTTLALGIARSSTGALVQGAGTTWRISAARFRRELAQSEALRRSVDRYLFVRMAQMTTGAACLRFHLIGPRLARWLLMSQDRAYADRFRVTHEFLSAMLGVRRVGVTAAAGALQRAGLITYHRGALTVVNREGLEAQACSCYQADLKAYRDHLS